LTPVVRAIAALAVTLAAAHARADEAPPRSADAARPLPARDTRAFVVLAPTFDATTAPRPAAGLALGVDVRHGALAWRLSSAAFLANAAPGGPSVALFDVLAAVCALGPLGGGYGVGLCGGGGLGLLRAVSAAGSTSLRARPELTASARFDAPLSKWLVLSAEAGTLWDVARPRLGEPTYRPSLLTLRASLGLALRFW